MEKKPLKPYEFEDGEDRDKTVVILIASILLGLSLYWFQDEIGADTTVLIAVIVGLVNAFTLIVNGFFQRSKKNDNGGLDIKQLIEETRRQHPPPKESTAEVDKNEDIDIDAELRRIKNGQ